MHPHCIVLATAHPYNDGSYGLSRVTCWG